MKLRFLILSILLPLSLAAQNNLYRYPMDIPMIMSASFCELRPNHFHAGLDITTAGEIGVEVKSAADGYVSRIRVSPFGYGHALYITHYDGYTTLYGHLSGYAPKI
ncbi:MAG: M23 family metallopeptidase, partial [Bacteroidales bacterium]|nr:M23 family metallopeptidase [Bacteroidales bacterium]